MPKAVSDKIKSMVKKFIMPSHWIDSEIFYALPILLGTSLSSEVRDPALWALASLLNTTWKLDPDSLQGKGSRAVKTQVVAARADFSRITADPDPVEFRDFFPARVADGPNRQSAIYSALMKGTHRVLNCSSLTQTFFGES